MAQYDEIQKLIEKELGFSAMQNTDPSKTESDLYLEAIAAVKKERNLTTEEITPHIDQSRIKRKPRV